jgi:hypothetical protein
MNEQKVQKLLQQYFDGATSLDEERALQRYFAESDIPDSLKAYRPMFAFFVEERAVEPPKQKTVIRSIRPILSIVVGIAASIAIFFFVAMPKQQHDNYVYYVDGQRIYDETAAIALAENKLQMLAVSMQKAQVSMAAFGKVQESAQSLQQLNKISNAYRQIEMLGAKIEGLTN